MTCALHVALVTTKREKIRPAPATPAGKGHQRASEHGQLQQPGTAGLWEGGVSHAQTALPHTSGDLRPGKVPSPETEPALQRCWALCFGFPVTFSWQTRADTYAPPTLYLYPIKKIPCFCKQYDERCIFNTIVCSRELT